MFNYILELPIQFKDAKRRGLRRDIAKLLVVTETEKVEKESVLLRFGELIYATRSKGAVIHAQPIGSFSEIEAYRDSLKKCGITYWFSSDFGEQSKRGPNYLTVECDSAQKCFKILKIFDAEAIVFFSSTQNDRDINLEKRLIETPYYANYELPYLEGTQKYGFFVFFAESHMSLEILGMEYPVIACLMTFLELENRFPSNG